MKNKNFLKGQKQIFFAKLMAIIVVLSSFNFVINHNADETKALAGEIESNGEFTTEKNIDIENLNFNSDDIETIENATPSSIQINGEFQSDTEEALINEKQDDELNDATEDTNTDYSKTSTNTFNSNIIAKSRITPYFLRQELFQSNIWAVEFKDNNHDPPSPFYPFKFLFEPGAGTTYALDLSEPRNLSFHFLPNSEEIYTGDLGIKIFRYDGYNLPDINSTNDLLWEDNVISSSIDSPQMIYVNLENAAHVIDLGNGLYCAVLTKEKSPDDNTPNTAFIAINCDQVWGDIMMDYLPSTSYNPTFMYFNDNTLFRVYFDPTVFLKWSINKSSGEPAVYTQEMIDEFEAAGIMPIYPAIVGEPIGGEKNDALITGVVFKFLEQGEYFADLVVYGETRYRTPIEDYKEVPFRIIRPLTNIGGKTNNYVDPMTTPPLILDPESPTDITVEGSHSNGDSTIFWRLIKPGTPAEVISGYIPVGSKSHTIDVPIESGLHRLEVIETINGTGESHTTTGEFFVPDRGNVAVEYYKEAPDGSNRIFVDNGLNLFYSDAPEKKIQTVKLATSDIPAFHNLHHLEIITPDRATSIIEPTDYLATFPYHRELTTIKYIYTEETKTNIAVEHIWEDGTKVENGAKDITFTGYPNVNQNTNKLSEYTISKVEVNGTNTGDTNNVTEKFPATGTTKISYIYRKTVTPSPSPSSSPRTSATTITSNTPSSSSSTQPSSSSSTPRSSNTTKNTSTTKSSSQTTARTSTSKTTTSAITSKPVATTTPRTTSVPPTIQSELVTTGSQVVPTNSETEVTTVNTSNLETAVIPTTTSSNQTLPVNPNTLPPSTLGLTEEDITGGYNAIDTSTNTKLIVFLDDDNVPLAGIMYYEEMHDSQVPMGYSKVKGLDIYENPYWMITKENPKTGDINNLNSIFKIVTLISAGGIIYLISKKKDNLLSN